MLPLPVPVTACVVMVVRIFVRFMRCSSDGGVYDSPDHPQPHRRRRIGILG
jgi:hypothetical protein